MEICMSYVHGQYPKRIVAGLLVRAYCANQAQCLQGWSRGKQLKAIVELELAADEAGSKIRRGIVDFVNIKPLRGDHLAPIDHCLGTAFLLFGPPLPSRYFKLCDVIENNVAVIQFFLQHSALVLHLRALVLV